MRHVGEEGVLGVCGVPGLLKGILQEPPLSQFFLPLFLNIRKSQKDLHVPAASDPYAFDLIILRSTGVSASE